MMENLKKRKFWPIRASGCLVKGNKTNLLCSREFSISLVIGSKVQEFREVQVPYDLGDSLRSENVPQLEADIRKKAGGWSGDSSCP
jgi:hypothetical protein